MNAYSCSNDQRRLHGRPQREMCSVLWQSEIPVSDLQHVRVVVSPEVDGAQLEAVQVGDGGDTWPVR
jgi:hypothetical protein